MHFWLRDVQRAVSICAQLEGVAQAGGENTGISSLQRCLKLWEHQAGSMGGRGQYQALVDSGTKGWTEEEVLQRRLRGGRHRVGQQGRQVSWKPVRTSV